MPIRRRDGNWHYRFELNKVEYSGNTHLADTERNRIAAGRKEAKARELVHNGNAHELKLEVKRFNDAADAFLKWADGEHRDHPPTARRLRVSFTSLGIFFGKRPVSSILRRHVKEFKTWRQTEHEVEDITIRHDLHALSAAFKEWIDRNWARENPVHRDDIPSDKDAVRIHVVTVEEESLYFDAARRFPALHDLGRLMLNQGCRPDEILNLQPGDVDVTKALLRIREGKSRAARRTLKLTAESLRILARRAALGTPWLFPGKLPGSRLAKVNGPHGRVLDDLAVCECTHRRRQHEKGKCACGCAEFKEAFRVAFVIYDFRHTFATLRAQDGMPLATLAAILGHADQRSVGRYIHVQQEAQDRAMLDYEHSTSRVPIETVELEKPIRKPAAREEFGDGQKKERVN